MQPPTFNLQNEVIIRYIKSANTRQDTHTHTLAHSHTLINTDTPAHTQTHFLQWQERV